MSSFFTVPAAQRKRKRVDAGERLQKRPATNKIPAATRLAEKPQKRVRRDEEISGSESEDEDTDPRRIDDGVEDDDLSEEDSEREGETAAEKRLRLAERYLENIREEVDEVGFDAEEIDRDLIAERLKEDVAESKGKLYRALADELSCEEASHTFFRNDSRAVNSVALCPPFAYTVSKDMCLVKWRIQDLPLQQWQSRGNKPPKNPPPPRRRPERMTLIRGNKTKIKDKSYQGHVDSILAVAASQDGKFVVTGGQDRRIIVWDAATLQPLRVFSQHRDAVTALVFRRGTNQMYSSSKDRTIKVWSLDELAYIETLFGHQDEVVDIAALAQERCVSVGARDRTARLWKVADETQLVFRGGGGEKKSRHGTKSQVLEGSMDRVAMIDEEMFVTGGDNGSISLWVTHKKKPIHTLFLAHGMDPPLAPDEASAEVHPEKSSIPAAQPRWITALATIPYSDVILSGSWDGHIRMWKVSEDKKRLERMGILGIPTITTLTNGTMHGPINGTSAFDDELQGIPSVSESASSEERQLVRGVVNDIAVCERGDRGKDGLCVVVACGQEHRFGRWLKREGKNGAVVFEVPRVKPKINGFGHVDGEEHAHAAIEE